MTYCVGIEVDEGLVAEVLAMSTGIPVVKLTEAESAKLLGTT